MNVGLPHFLTVAVLLFSLGFYTVATRKNAVGILMGVELILNAANINYLAFSRYSSGSYDGQVYSIFVIMLAAAEAAIGMAIVLGLYRRFRSIDVGRMTELHG